mgnify:CR=1 FL=1
MKGRAGQLVRYGGTGGLAAIVDLMGFVLLTQVGIGIALAAALSFLLATVVNYVLTARFVFVQKASWRGYGRFLLAAVSGFAVNVGMTVMMLRLFGLSPAVSKALGIAVAFFANFTLNALLVFPQDNEADTSRRKKS